MFGEKPHQTDAAAKIATPAMKIRRRPKRSPAAPPSKRNAESVRVYALTSHWMTTTDAPRSVSIAGRETLTTDSSMKEMLDARIAASKTHGFAAAAQSPVARVVRIVASSHGLDLELTINWSNADSDCQEYCIT